MKSVHQNVSLHGQTKNSLSIVAKLKQSSSSDETDQADGGINNEGFRRDRESNTDSRMETNTFGAPVFLVKQAY